MIPQQEDKRTFPPRLRANATWIVPGEAPVWVATENDEPAFVPYLSVAEHEALLREERAKAFEEAAEYLYTVDSSDSSHETVEQNAKDFLALAKAARAEKGEA